MKSFKITILAALMLSASAPAQAISWQSVKDYVATAARNGAAFCTRNSKSLAGIAGCTAVGSSIGYILARKNKTVLEIKRCLNALEAVREREINELGSFVTPDSLKHIRKLAGQYNSDRDRQRSGDDVPLLNAHRAALANFLNRSFVIHGAFYGFLFSSLIAMIINENQRIIQARQSHGIK